MIKIKIIVVVVLFVIGAILGYGISSIKTEPTEIKSSITSLRETGKLEVMSASVNINRKLFITKDDTNEYAAIYNVPGTAVYTVDLSKLEIDYVKSDNGKYKLIVGIPELEQSLNVKEDEAKKLDDYQKGKYTGSAKEGFEEYLTIVKESYDKAKKEISNSEGLISMAKESAKTQISLLIKSLNTENCEIVMYFI